MPFHLRPMPAREQGEHHRVATPVELFFDLVAVAQVACDFARLARVDRTGALFRRAHLTARFDFVLRA